MIAEFKAKIQENFSENGQAMVEYAIVIAVVAIIAVAVFMSEGGGGKSFTDSVNSTYEKADNAINEIQ